MEARLRWIYLFIMNAFHTIPQDQTPTTLIPWKKSDVASETLLKVGTSEMVGIRDGSSWGRNLGVHANLSGH
jgi:hypothetical protein